MKKYEIIKNEMEIFNSCLNATAAIDDLVPSGSAEDSRAFSCRLINDNSNIIVFSKGIKTCKAYIERCLGGNKIMWKIVHERKQGYLGYINGSIEICVIEVNPNTFKPI